MENKSLPSHGKFRKESRPFKIPDWAKKDKIEISPLEKEKEILFEMLEEMRTIEDQLFPKGSEPITLPEGVINIDEYEKKLSKRHAELEKLIPLQEEKIRNMENIKDLANNISEN